MIAVLIQNSFNGISRDAKDAKMLLNISSPMHYVINGELALNLFEICLDNTSQISGKSLLSMQNFEV